MLVLTGPPDGSIIANDSWLVKHNFENYSYLQKSGKITKTLPERWALCPVSYFRRSETQTCRLALEGASEPSAESNS